MEWIGSLPFKGNLCFDTEDYCSSLEMNLELFEGTTCFSLQGHETDCSVQPVAVPHHGGIWKEFWRPNSYQQDYSKPQDALGTMPLHQMVVVVVRPTTYLHSYCYAVMAGSSTLFLSKDHAGSMFLLHLSKK